VHMSDLDEFSKLSHGGDPWQRNNEVGVDTGVNPDAHQLIEIHILFFTSVHKDALDSEPCANYILPPPAPPDTDRHSHEFSSRRNVVLLVRGARRLWPVRKYRRPF
jgi:hypothetical protein